MHLNSSNPYVLTAMLLATFEGGGPMFMEPATVEEAPQRPKKPRPPRIHKGKTNNRAFRRNRHS